MVESVFGEVEWCLLPSPSYPPTEGAHDLGRVRLLGVWSLARVSLVSSNVGPQVPATPDCRKGANPDRSRVCHLGPALVGPLSGVFLRQPGGDIVHPITHKGIMHLLRCLVFVEARFGFSIMPMYISTKANFLADDLSRNNLVSFLSKVPQADSTPTKVSVRLLELLLDQQADWTSRTWRPQFRAIFNEA